MREIIFRGRELGTSEWIEGQLCHDGHRTWIVYDNDFTDDVLAEILFADRYREVEPATVGQYTGLTDKNETRIFEGDICKHKDICDQTVTRIIRFGVYEQDGSGGEYSPRECLGFYGERVKTEAPDYLDEDDLFVQDCDQTISVLQMGECEVIGSIHTTPELIGGQESE